MFLYNKYQSTQPANVDKGERTISFGHLSDPSVVWQSVQGTDFLRTVTGALPTKDASDWKKGFEPDKAATQKQAKSLSTDAGVGDSGQAMVASGLKPCGEPCRCGAGRSKHLENLAADLNSNDLDKLTTKLTEAKDRDIDAYLKKIRTEPAAGQSCDQS